MKYWLEEMAFEVQMSEHTDFEHRPEDGAFEACFAAVRESDYYVLLIGEKRGSWFSPTERVTVTQQEYRVAYEAFMRTGKPRPVIFIRESVLTIIRERQAAGTATSADSTLEDPAFTTAFVREARREEDTEKALVTGGELPRGNWVAGFTGFRDLMDGLRTSLRIRGPLPRVALEETLRQELSRNLRMMMMKHDGHAFYLHFYLDDVRDSVELPDDDWDGSVRLTFQQIKRSHMYIIGGVPLPSVLVRTALDNAISTGYLLDYNTETARYEPSSLLTGLLRLREALDVFDARYQGLTEIRSHLWPLWDAVRVPQGDGELPVMTLTSLFGLHDSQRDVTRLLLAILRNLYGHCKTIDVQLRPVSPVPGQDDKIDAERVSQEQIEEWLGEDNAYLAIGMTDRTPEQAALLKAAVDVLREKLGEQGVRELLQRVTETAAERFGKTPEEMRPLVEKRLGDVAED